FGLAADIHGTLGNHESGSASPLLRLTAWASLRLSISCWTSDPTSLRLPSLPSFPSVHSFSVCFPPAAPATAKRLWLRLGCASLQDQAFAVTAGYSEGP